MKSTLLVLFHFCVIVCTAQIQFTRGDFGGNGDKVIYAVDSPSASGFNFGGTGANRTWRFNTKRLYPRRYDSTLFITTTINPGAPQIPTNLLARSIAGGDQFLLVTDSFVKTTFNFPEVNVTGVTLQTLKFPLTYQSQFSDSTNVVAKGLLADFGLDPLPPFDSIRINAKVTLNSTCDGWGILILPDTTSHNTLKVNQQINIEADVYLHSIIGWTYITHRSQQMDSYNWYGVNSNSYLASVQLDTSGNISNFIYKIKQSPPVYLPRKLTSITPDSLMQGDTMDITIIGSNTHFTSGPPDLFFAAGPIFNEQVINDTVIQATVTCHLRSSPGAYYFRVYTPVDGVVSLNNGITIIPSPLAPRLVAIGPGYGAAGQRISVSITGYHTHFTKGINISFAADSASDGSIFVQSYNVINDTLLTCDILIENNAAYIPFTIYTDNATDGSLSLKGAFTVTHTGLAENLSENISVYPNPVHDILTIELPGNHSPVTVQLLDMSGKEMERVTTSDSLATLRTGDLRQSLYILKITGDQLNMTRKILVQHE